MANYTINGQTPENGRIDSGTIQQSNQGPGSFTFTVAGDWNGSLPYDVGDQVTVNKGGTRFVGTVKRKPRRTVNSNGDEAFIVTAWNGWRDLEETPYLQSWSSIEKYDTAISRIPVPAVALCQDDDGLPVKTGIQISQIIDFAISKGANITKGSIFAGIDAPATDMQDCTCADAIRYLLRWTPDAVVWWAGKQINIQRQGALSTVSISSAPGEMLDFSAESCDDMVPNGVLVAWKTTHSIDDQEVVEWIRDTAGDIDEAPFLTATFNLQGTQVRGEKVKIVTRTRPDPDELEADEAKRFFRGNIEWLSTVSLDDIAIQGLTYEIIAAENEDPIYKDGTETVNDNARPFGKKDGDDTEIEDLPRQLVDGQLRPWMHKIALPVRVQATVFYKGDNPQIIKRMEHVAWSTAAGAHYYSIQFDRQLILTNAQGRTYKHTDSYEIGESPVEGLANTILETCQVSAWEGFATGVAEGDFLDAKLGEKLRISGAMDTGAVIQSLSENVVDETVTASFGFPQHLSPQDIKELNQLAVRNRVFPVSAKMRTEAEAGAEGGPQGGVYQATPTANAQPAEGGANLSGLPWSLIDCSTWDPDALEAKCKLAPGSTLSSGAGGGKEITIGNYDDVHTLSAGKVLYLKGVGSIGEEWTVTLEFGDIWSEYPNIGKWNEDDEQEEFYYLLWRFVADDDADHLKKPGKAFPGIKGVRVAEFSHLTLRLITVQTGTGSKRALEYPLAGAKATPESL